MWNGRTCQSPAELCKQKGGIWDGSKCQPKTNPADECKKKGGTWDGKRCLPKTGRPTLTAPGGSPAEQCRKAGKFWDGKQCLGRAEQCRATGGVWDKATKTCKPATLSRGDRVFLNPGGSNGRDPALGFLRGFMQRRAARADLVTIVSRLSGPDVSVRGKSRWSRFAP